MRVFNDVPSRPPLNWGTGCVCCHSGRTPLALSLPSCLFCLLLLCGLVPCSVQGEHSASASLSPGRGVRPPFRPPFNNTAPPEGGLPPPPPDKNGNAMVSLSDTDC